MSERIPAAEKHPKGFYEARPGDVAGRADLVFIDVRPTEDLLGDWGHIHEIRSLPADGALSSGFNPDQALVLVCENGRQSRDLASRLVNDYHFVEVYHLVGGMVRWTAEDRPVARVRTWK